VIGRLQLNGRSFRFTVDLARECFTDVAFGIERLGDVAAAVVGQVPTSRVRGNSPLRIVAARRPDTRGAAIEFHRADLPAFRSALVALKVTAQRTGGIPPAVLVQGQLMSTCFTSFIASLITTPPRSVSISARRVTLCLPAALLAVRALVALAQGPVKSERVRDAARIRARLDDISTEDSEIAAYLLVGKRAGWNHGQSLVVGLVDRAFRGAWEAHALPGLVYRVTATVAAAARAGAHIDPLERFRDPRHAMRAYSYRGTDALQDHIRKLSRPHQDLWLRWAEKTYLGEPGAATAAFRLSTRQ
jgi:hypothetical protein